MTSTELGKLISMCHKDDAQEAGILVHELRDGEYTVSLFQGSARWVLRIKQEARAQFTVTPEGLIHTEELKIFWKSLEKLANLKEQRDFKAREIRKSHDQFLQELGNLKFYVHTDDGGMKTYG